MILYGSGRSAMGGQNLKSTANGAISRQAALKRRTETERIDDGNKLVFSITVNGDDLISQGIIPQLCCREFHTQRVSKGN